MKKYFTEVQTYSNVNKLGDYMAKQAMAYNHCIISDDCWQKMVDNLNAILREAKKKFPRTRKELVIVDSKPRSNELGEFQRYCTCHPMGDYNNDVFIINTKIVESDFLTGNTMNIYKNGK